MGKALHIILPSTVSYKILEVDYYSLSRSIKRLDNYAIIDEIS